MSLTAPELAFSRRAFKCELFIEARMTFASAISPGLHRQRIRALTLGNLLAKFATIVIEQRMAVARSEIERARERLWFGKNRVET